MNTKTQTNDQQADPKAAEHHHHHDGDGCCAHHPKIGRNDPCACGSGKKYKKCCLSSQAK